MLARRIVCWTDGVFGFAITEKMKLVIYFRVCEGADTVDSVAAAPTFVTHSHNTLTAGARCSGNSPGEMSGDPF